MLNFQALRDAPVATEPFTYLAADGLLSADEAKAIRESYPDIRQTGYLPNSGLQGGEAYNALIRDLESSELADVLSDQLGLNLRDKPRMITVRRHSKMGDGRIHNDSESKICTFLVYLNADWSPEQGGGIRALNGESDMDDYAAEVPPTFGHGFAFARSDTSWHGHPGFAGERFVVQTTFLVDQAALDRKEKRGGLQKTLRKFFERS